MYRKTYWQPTKTPGYPMHPPTKDMRKIPEYNGTYRCRLPFDYDYNAIYAQMELQAQEETYHTTAYRPRRFQAHQVQENDLKYGKASAEEFVQFHYVRPLEEKKANAANFFAAKTDEEKQASQTTAHRCAVEADNCLRFMEEYLLHKGWPKDGYMPVNHNPEGNLADIARGRHQVFQNYVTQAQFANRNAQQTSSCDDSPSFVAKTEQKTIQRHVPEKYDYNVIYTQFEQLAQLKSYPPGYAHHLGAYAWDAKYGRLSAEAFYNMYYAEPREKMQECANALCTAKTDAETDALEQQIQDCQIQMENSMRFMQEYYEREGWPQSGYTPVQIKQVGNLETITESRNSVFREVTLFTEILYDGTWFSRLPSVYDYDKIYPQLLSTPDTYDINLSRNNIRNGQVAGEMFFNARYLQMLKKIEKHEKAMVGIYKETDRNFLETQIQHCIFEKNNCMRFIQEYVKKYKNFRPSSSYVEYKEYGAYLAFASILEQLSQGYDPYDVKSMYPYTDQPYVNAKSILDLYGGGREDT